MNAFRKRIVYPSWEAAVAKNGWGAYVWKCMRTRLWYWSIHNEKKDVYLITKHANGVTGFGKYFSDEPKFRWTRKEEDAKKRALDFLAKMTRQRPLPEFQKCRWQPAKNSIGD